MDIARRLLAPIAIQDRENRVISVDLASFVPRLLLFDTCILQSVWLQDVILLQHSFTPAGLSLLFESGALKFECPGFTFGQTGQALSTITSGSQPPARNLPLFNYQFSVVRVKDADEKLERALGALDSGLREQVIRNRAPLPSDYHRTVFESFYRDLTSELTNAAVKIELRKKGIVPSAHHLQVVSKGNDEFAVENDLPRKYLLPSFEAHRMIESAMLAVGRLNERIASMRTYSALTGLTEDDKPLLDAKIGATADLLPERNDQQFSRVIALKGLPVPKYGSSVVDVKALLKLRDSEECRAFKDWLSGSQQLSDEEIRERVTGFGRRIREGVSSKTGRAIRFVVSNGLGILLGFSGQPVGMLGGLAISATDSFLLERLLPKDAIITFLSESYPSLFKS